MLESRPDRHIPILVGGNSAPALRRAAANDGWIGTASTVDDVKRAVRLAGEHADPSTLTFASGCTLDITQTDHDDPRHLRGTPAQIADRIHQLEHAGLTHLELRLTTLRDPHRISLAATLETLEAFLKRVRPL